MNKLDKIYKILYAKSLNTNLNDVDSKNFDRAYNNRDEKNRYNNRLFVIRHGKKTGVAKNQYIYMDNLIILYGNYLEILENKIGETDDKITIHGVLLFDYRFVIDKIYANFVNKYDYEPGKQCDFKEHIFVYPKNNHLFQYNVEMYDYENSDIAETDGEAMDEFDEMTVIERIAARQRLQDQIDAEIAQRNAEIAAENQRLQQIEFRAGLPNDGADTDNESEVDENDQNGGKRNKRKPHKTHKKITKKRSRRRNLTKRRKTQKTKKRK
jgi:hypothetical protein